MTGEKKLKISLYILLMADTLSIMLFIHITSVVIWFSSIPIYMAMEKILKNTKDTGAVLGLLSPISISVMISQFFVLISGGALAGTRWFQFTTSGWLALKQVIFFLLLGLSHGLILKNFRTLKKEGEEMEHDQLVSDFSKNVKMSYLVGIFILVNIFLATTKFI